MELEQQVAAIVTKHPRLQYMWAQNQPSVGTQLKFPKVAAEGFDIVLDISNADIVVRIGELDEAFRIDVHGGPALAVRYALGLVRDLLSPAMRLRILSAGGRPYRWVLESSDDGVWKAENLTGRIFYRYFGRRSEAIFQNSQLPAREVLWEGSSHRFAV